MWNYFWIWVESLQISVACLPKKTAGEAKNILSYCGSFQKTQVFFWGKNCCKPWKVAAWSLLFLNRAFNSFFRSCTVSKQYMVDNTTWKILIDSGFFPHEKKSSHFASVCRYWTQLLCSRKFYKIKIWFILCSAQAGHKFVRLVWQKIYCPRGY